MAGLSSLVAILAISSVAPFAAAAPQNAQFISVDADIVPTDLVSNQFIFDSVDTQPAPALPEFHSQASALEPNVRDSLKIECSAAGVKDWDRNLQIASVFIILSVGGLGALLPVACKHIKWLNVIFGAGVILATAFVHMLNGSIESLKDECLEGRLGDFDAWPGFLAMLAILAMHLMEHVLTARLIHHKNTSLDTARCSVATESASAGEVTPEYKDEECGDEKRVDVGHVHAPMLLDMDQKRKQLSTYILELGIALHSIIVGMTLAVTGGTGFKTLLAAISFHQFFEGLALGTRISALHFTRRPLLMGILNASIFALTTPLGQIIGIGIRESFAPRSPSTLLTIGVLDGLSAGILMYSAIVNLLVEEFSSPEFRRYTKFARVMYFIILYSGCAAMSIIGKWA
ncbi:ZIP zinc transporter-domain-containing protein [Kickxella alabastrina]|uniref:ZIP zinc transporter-domain-containing protein n=1 Tax=Kickxella alabastrina TaxID=61397 RepID=UPI002220AA41|nr:ZIP zinc transporter-domain-containing protein [Kickxella alabastrina]KAI7825414.1 ZIP zinc transporter-domain-containing protein [Kickxella alabastrina]